MKFIDKSFAESLKSNYPKNVNKKLMSRIKEEIVWMNEFIDYTRYDLTKFLKTITEKLSEIPETFKNESFINFGAAEKFGDLMCEIKIGYTRPPTSEEKAAFDKLQESKERACFNKAKSDYERLKAKFEKN